jgi:hypothetical protein
VDRSSLLLGVTVDHAPHCDIKWKGAHMEGYDVLKAKLAEVAELVKQYPEALQGKVFDILMDEEIRRPTPKEAPKPPHTGNEPAKVVKPKNTSSKAAAKQRAPKRVPNLELGHATEESSFPALLAIKKPRSNFEFNTVAVYYLTEKLELTDVTADHIFTCYDHVNERVPTAFAQSIRDTSGKKGWLDVSSWDNIKLTPKGRNLVTHDLPAAPEGDKK